MESDSDSKIFVKAFMKFQPNHYFGDTISSLIDFDEIFSELHEIMQGLEGQKIAFFTYFRLENLILIYKNYYILLGTINDLFASVLNIVYDLGIDEKDVKSSLVLNNKHVKESGIQSILQKYQKLIDYDKSIKYRNDIAHRNIINDKEIKGLLEKRNSIRSKRYSILHENNITDEEYKRQMVELDKEIISLFANKKTFFYDHLEKVKDMIHEVTPILANKFYNQMIIKGNALAIN